MIDVTPEPAVSPWAALEQQRDELDAEREEAIADGRWEDVQRITADLEAVKRTVALIKKDPRVTGGFQRTRGCQTRRSRCAPSKRVSISRRSA